MRILVIGFGSIGKRHLENLMNVSNNQLIICSKRNDLEGYKKKGVIIHRTLNEALKDKPDVAFVTNETSLHVPTAIMLAKNNTHLFLEKPLSNSKNNLNKLKTISNKEKIITQIGCNMRYHPCIIKIKKMLNADVLGKVISVQIESGSYLPDWHPYEDYRMGYAANDDLGGGIALTCIHEIDLLYWFFGKPKEVFSITGKYGDLEVKTDDHSSMILRFKNNIIAEVHLDYLQRPEFKRCKIRGTKGIVYWDSDINEVKFYSRKLKRWSKKMKVSKFQKNEMYVNEIKDFLKCIKNNSASMNNLSDGINTLKIVLTAKDSSKKKKLLKINYD